MARLLEELAALESPTTRPESQNPVLSRLATELSGVGYRVRRLPGRETGGQLFARPVEPRAGAPLQLVLGHCDTVWPTGTLEEMPIRREGEKLLGPGVFDMKGGLVQLLHALRLHRDLELAPEVTPVVLVTTDEEIGSPESERWIRLLARRASRCLVLEPALGPEGRLKTARRGVGHFELRIHGRSAHVGLDPGKGASAILELSRLVQTLHEMDDPERGISVNVGEIEGGTRPNVVASGARAVVDVRVPTREAARRIEREIHSLRTVTPGTRLEVQGGVGRAPMERTPRNRRLWEAARRTGQRLGLELEEGTSGGASDGNITSLYTATLDGLGAVGDGAHAEHEYVLVPELPKRCALLAGLLLLPPLEPRRVPGDGTDPGHEGP